MQLDDLFGKPVSDENKKSPWDTGFHIGGLPKKIFGKNGEDTGYFVAEHPPEIRDREGKRVAIISGIRQIICTLEGEDTGYFVSGTIFKGIFYLEPFSKTAELYPTQQQSQSN